MKKPPLWATIFTFLGVIILCTLGTWQLQRLTWKTEILNGLAAAYENPQTQITHDILTAQDFAYGTLTGTLQWSKAFKANYKVIEGAAGNDLIVPINTNEGDTLINLGFIPEMHTLASHPIARFDGKEITIIGLARKADWNSFTPENNPAKNLWYRLNIEQISQHFALKSPAQFIIYAHDAKPTLSDTLPNNTRWQPNNNHQQYALFWFAMALTLIAIFYIRFLKN